MIAHWEMKTGLRRQLARCHAVPGRDQAIPKNTCQIVCACASLCDPATMSYRLQPNNTLTPPRHGGAQRGGIARATMTRVEHVGRGPDGWGEVPTLWRPHASPRLVSI
jgi:hypothetical protein